MNIPITGPRAYSPTAGSIPEGASSRRPADKAGAEFVLDLARAVTPAEAKALAESFGTLPTHTPTAGEFRGRHIDIRA